MKNPAVRAVAAILPLATAWRADAQTFQRFADIPYGDGDPAQRLDVYVPVPVPQRLRPVILWIHGGGWQSGDKLLNTGRVNAMLARGFIVASTNYRLTGTAQSPAQIHDCKAAVRFLRANAAQYRIDPSRIGVWGSSAGGHLVAHLGSSGGGCGRRRNGGALRRCVQPRAGGRGLLRAHGLLQCGWLARAAGHRRGGAPGLLPR
jgi:acetyl esterase/lipase